jgi:hypothetical protein
VEACGGSKKMLKKVSGKSLNPSGKHSMDLDCLLRISLSCAARLKNLLTGNYRVKAFFLRIVSHLHFTHITFQTLKTNDHG